MDDFDPDEARNTLDAEEDDSSGWASSSGAVFSSWEEQCLQEAEDQTDLETQLMAERDASNHRLFLSFQAAACFIAQLYKDRHQGSMALWMPFQSAAGSVTNLYKDCLESQKRITELGIQSGIQRRNREMLSWLKKKKRSAGGIRREELIGFVCGKKMSTHGASRLSSADRSGWTPVNRHHPSAAAGSAAGLHAHHRSPSSHPLTFSCLSLSDSSPAVSGSATSSDPIINSDALQTFRDALALSVIRNGPQGLNPCSSSPPINNSSSSNVNMCRRTSMSQGRNSNNSSAQFGIASCHQNTHPSSTLAELNAFISEEFTRHVDSKKRSAPSSTDVTMASPTHKKTKYF